MCENLKIHTFANLYECLMTNCKKIYWIELSSNPSGWAENLLKANPSKIDWRSLSKNSSDWAGKLLLTNLAEVCWVSLSSNPSDWAGELLEANPENIDWYQLLLSNPSNFAHKLFLKNPKCGHGLLHNESWWATEIYLKKTYDSIFHQDFSDLDKYL